MKINGTPYRSVWRDAADPRLVHIFDQTRLPWELDILDLKDMDAVAHAIRSMQVRGAPLIGAVAAYGLAFALDRDPSDQGLHAAAAALVETRPTAINLRWAIERMVAHLKPVPPGERADAAYREADAICDEDVEVNEAIGRHGLALFKELWDGRRPGQERLNLLTHCNAGWIATVDWGTALAPIYMAHDLGIPVHVWVDETRPRNQGALLTAWELGAHGVPHTLVADNAGGHLMQHGNVDCVIVGTDRVTRQGDVANKIGTYLKALAAHDNNVPFWVALPSSTIDWRVRDGMQEIPIEERSAEEVTFVHGLNEQDRPARLRVTPKTTQAANPAFDVTPARLVTGLLTERGPCAATAEGLAGLFPEQARA
ncbi:methylthioribose-1-phosphate isomerase [Neoasaia chiangmaiensis NBRC 101099]|uniref:Methylthioribose-1-phosphate isomerase n=1 Tax=Neoasaia chiangmaiensis TaxID=320497 RepID=A0A1U9KM19_9PROT|nr:S-methyl-5-thioribose-1-phosphate isomerase [Neoasaia chiangmaiensis]AQS86841.1 S-methyl-5-thioribose-1-phosphate isomerase [Neoasaia chiangmaiensis]GBR37358.1 methylthioribose-1-phosphate isomerase [Neoasaia chiangmaiensis NBRC 101099]GEN14913.1 methylthioribose-1-phosphate isomerase [Neoasaia chiangmaiensis]